MILSGYSDFKYLNMSIRSHVAEYLLKPTDIDDFEETFRRLKAAMDHEQLRRAQITESVLRHFHVWLTAMLGGVATPEDTDRFLPMLTEAGIDLDNLQVAAFVLDGHGGDERPDQVALWRRVWEVTAALPAGPLRRLSFLLGGEDMVVLYSSGEEIAPGDVRADIEAIQRAVRDGLRVTLSAGVSDLCTEPGMLPQAYEQANCSAKQSAFAGQEAVYFFSQMQKERPAGMPYFDTEQVEKALLAQDYDALRAEIDRMLLPLAESLPEYRAVDQLCLSLLFHVSLWGLRYGIQMEEVLRALGAHYTDVYQSETLAAKRGFVLACLFGCQQALAALGRTGLYTLIYVPVIMVLSFILAYLLNKGVFWAKGIRSMFFLPYVSNMVAVAVVFQLMLGPRGPFYLLQKFFGVEDPIIPLLNQKWALPVVVLIAVWKGIGLNFLTYLGALQNVDKSQVEAAEIDGANKWQQIKNVVIPAVAPTTFFLTISSIITSLQNFTVIQSLTDGGPGQATTVMSLNIVNTAFVKYETSYAAAQALVMFAIVMVITLIQWRGQKKWADQ